MKIEIFSDFACPFCYIGKRRLEQAIHETGFEDEIEIEYKSYQLNPHASKTKVSLFHERMMEKHESAPEKLKQMTSSIQEQASQ